MNNEHMKQFLRTSLRHPGFNLFKTASHDSCLNQIEETLSSNEIGTDRDGQSGKMSKRRTTMLLSSSRSSIIDIPKTTNSGNKRFLSFIQKGFHGSRSRSASKLDHINFLKISIERNNLEKLNEVVPIPIRETAIQGYSRTLFHKIPQSNVRPKPLLKLDSISKFIPIHPSLLNKNFSYCVKIISLSPAGYRKCSSGNRYELLLPTGTRSLGHTCHIVNQLQYQCPSCNSSQVSFFGRDEPQKHMTAYLFSCISECERKKWLNILTRVARPNLQNERRREISLNLWIQEAKNVALKKKYFCEIYLDEALYARTTTKTMTDMLFWGEEFEFCNLEEIRVVTILLWTISNESKKKKKKPHQQLICQINIDTKDIDQRNSIEKWYSSSNNFSSSSSETAHSSNEQSNNFTTNSSGISISKSLQTTTLSHANSSLISNDQIPMIRVKARYQNLDVLPINEYSNFMQYLEENAVPLILEIEPYLKVKNKEDLARNLVNVIHKQKRAAEFLSELIFHEINKADDQNMVLRGNTMASKAIEMYLKLIGEKYLNLTLSDFVNRILRGEDDCEVDPEKEKYNSLNSMSLGSYQSSVSNEKSSPHFNLQQRQESLLMNVDMVWAKIMSSSIYFPKDLKSVFIALRARLEKANGNFCENNSNKEPNLCDRIVSACIFLRYICPAILTPSMFGLIPEYPDNAKIIRTFTLIAKCIQTLANFSDLTGTKESYMIFMNNFIENKFETMYSFLRKISTDGPEEFHPASTEPDQDHQNGLYWENLSNTLAEDTIDLSLCLSKLHRQLEDYLKMIPAQKLSKNTEVLYKIIEDINFKLRVREAIPIAQSVKSSQSVQDIKGNRIQNLSNERIYSDIKYSSSNTLTRVINKPMIESTNHHLHSNYAHPDASRSSVSKASTCSYSAETSPIHSIFDNKTGTNSTYLMTQSMIEHNHKNIMNHQCGSLCRDQINKEWQEMVSESSVRMSQGEELIPSSPYQHYGLKSETPSYQNVHRPINNLNVVADYNTFNRSPTGVKNSVKKCKQYVKQLDSPGQQPDYFTHVIKQNEQSQMRNIDMRRSSCEERMHNKIYYSLAAPLEGTESCSTETITSNKMSSSETYQQVPVKSYMNSSISMPSFNNMELVNSLPMAYGKQNQVRPPNATDFKCSSNTSQFRENVNLMPPCPAANMVSNDVKVKNMKMSLNNLHHNLSARMTELILADTTTIQLELERVRLMKQICETAASQNPGSRRSGGFYNNIPSQDFNANNEPMVSNKLSVRRYLDVAESILVDVQQNHVNGRKSERETEHLLVQVFETNQSLQNVLINKLECYISNSDLQMKSPKEFRGSNDQKDREIEIHSVFKPTQGQDLAKMNSNIKQISLGSCSPSAIIELIDAV